MRPWSWWWCCCCAKRKAQQDRQDNVLLRAENESLKNENFRLQAAIRNVVCPNCGGPAILGEMSFDEQHLRIENARLKEEVIPNPSRIHPQAPLSNQMSYPILKHVWRDHKLHGMHVCGPACAPTDTCAKVLCVRHWSFVLHRSCTCMCPGCMVESSAVQGWRAMMQYTVPLHRGRRTKYGRS